MSGPVLQVRGLRALVGGGARARTLVEAVDLDVAAGECVALVGPSGSGKTVTARAALGLSADGVHVAADALTVDGEDMRGASERAWRRLRGRRVGYVGQEALGALDPLRPVGREVADALRLHTSRSAAERADAVADALARVGLDPALATSRTLAGELSGGMRQRALIAAATVADPALVVADEPTTALDAGIALTVMELLAAAQRRGAGVLLITHDRALVDAWADCVVEMRDGRVVTGGAADAGGRREARAASRPRTATAASPEPVRDPGREGSPDAGHEAAAPVLAAEHVDVVFDGVPAVADASLAVRPGRVLGVVGASGSGKTTLARVLLGLQRPSRGVVLLDGEAWAPLPERARRARRGRMAAVVQDPGATFDERWTVRRVLEDAAGTDDADATAAALARVGLDPSLAARSPRTLSGGQRQRLAIARALASEPEVLVLDEPVTALDAAVQDTVLTLLERLRDETGVAMVFVSHDLQAVRRMSDDVLVMDGGRVVESGPTEDVLERPAHPATARLVLAAERLAAGPLRAH